MGNRRALRPGFDPIECDEAKPGVCGPARLPWQCRPIPMREDASGFWPALNPCQTFCASRRRTSADARALHFSPVLKYEPYKISSSQMMGLVAGNNRQQGSGVYVAGAGFRRETSLLTSVLSLFPTAFPRRSRRQASAHKAKGTPKSAVRGCEAPARSRTADESDTSRTNRDQRAQTTGTVPGTTR